MLTIAEIKEMLDKKLKIPAAAVVITANDASDALDAYITDVAPALKDTDTKWKDYIIARNEYEKALAAYLANKKES